MNETPQAGTCVSFYLNIPTDYEANVIQYKEFEDIVIKMNPDTQNQGTHKHSPRFWMFKIMYLCDKTDVLLIFYCSKYCF